MHVFPIFPVKVGVSSMIAVCIEVFPITNYSGICYVCLAKLLTEDFASAQENPCDRNHNILLFSASCPLPVFS